MKKATPLPKGALSSILPFLPTSKSQLRKFQIVEGAIRCYAIRGIDGATFDEIAKEAKTSRPLLLHYFKTKDEILLLAGQYVRTRMQERALAALQLGGTALEMLDAYIKVCFTWVEEDPEHATFWLLFLAFSRQKEKFKELNDEAVLMGQKRIAALLERAHQEGSVSKGDFLMRAKLIQTHITGFTIQFGTERFTGAEKTKFIAAVLENVRRTAGQKL